MSDPKKTPTPAKPAFKVDGLTTTATDTALEVNLPDGTTRTVPFDMDMWAVFDMVEAVEKIEADTGGDSFATLAVIRTLCTDDVRAATSGIPPKWGLTVLLAWFEGIAGSLGNALT